jgi:DnaJ-class molecular chaperone
MHPEDPHADDRECTTCAGVGSFEQWANPGCLPGNENFRSVACPCCRGDGTLESDDLRKHDEDGSCCRDEGPDEDQMPGGKEYDL